MPELLIPRGGVDEKDDTVAFLQLQGSNSQPEIVQERSVSMLVSFWSRFVFDRVLL